MCCEFRRILDSCYARMIKLLRIQQQIIYPPPRLHSTRSPVFAATTLSALNSFGVFRPTNDVVTDSGQVAYSSASDQHYRVLLQVVPFARNICRYFDVVRETDSRYFSQCGVRLLGGDGANLQADTSFLRRPLLQLAGSARERVSDCAQSRCLGLFAGPLSRFSY